MLCTPHVPGTVSDPVSLVIHKIPLCAHRLIFGSLRTSLLDRCMYQLQISASVYLLFTPSLSYVLQDVRAQISYIIPFVPFSCSFILRLLSVSRSFVPETKHREDPGS